MGKYADEIWKLIDDYPEYEISNYGEVRRVGSDENLKPMKHHNDYLRVALYKNGIRKYFSLHRLIAINFIPNPENKPEVNHVDGVARNNLASNLEWVTREENMAHSQKFRAHLKGEGCHWHKYTGDLVLKMREYYQAGCKPKKIREIFRIPKSTLGYILSRHTWRHI